MENTPRPVLVATLALWSALALLSDDARAKKKEDLAHLAEKHRVWLAEVELIITKEERREFLEIEKDYQRDTFIESFWQARDPYPETERNEFKEMWYDRLEYAWDEFGNLTEDRARILLLNGGPSIRQELELCVQLLHPLEVWWYQESQKVGSEVALIFYRPFGGGRPQMWRPREGIPVLFTEPAEILLGMCRDLAARRFCPPTAVGSGDNPWAFEEIGLACAECLIKLRCSADFDILRAALRRIHLEDRLFDFEVMALRLEQPPEARDGEWLDTFAAYSTDVPEEAQTFTGQLELEFPGRYRTRTVVQGTLSVPTEQAQSVELHGRHSFNFQLTGEILRGEELFESFRYKFDVPAAETDGESIPLTFQRYLRPGPFSLVIKLEDLNSGRYYRERRDIEVPKLDTVYYQPTPQDPETARLVSEAEAAITADTRTLKLIPIEGERLTGPVRFDAVTTGPEFDRVAFFLNGKRMLTKNRPPYSIELDLGQVPRTHNVRVVGYGEDGEPLSSDELELNLGEHQFSVQLIEPQRNRKYQGSVMAEAEVRVPEGQTIERLELYLGETLLATLYQAPYRHPIDLPQSESLTYVRAVAYLEDGNSNEDMVFINAPDYLEEVDIQFVELYTSVLDEAGRPVAGLTADDFTVLEDGTEQSIARFEVVRDLPIHAGILLDTSASMEERLLQARDAALRFFEQTITPKDRATFITFNQRPALAAKFTSGVDTLAAQLAGLKAEGGTALYDSLVFSLYYFTGLKGQRALLLLSDGKDQSSRFTFKEALEYAQTVGVRIYTIGLDLKKGDVISRHELSKLANVTGGESYFIKDIAELDRIYAAIEDELRSQYLIAYQSSNTSGTGEFRNVELKVVRAGLDVRTLRGYYP